jgi:cystathionine beta-lyase/cystathionine gamma-synthase
MGFSTDAIHAGQYPDAATNAVITPIYMTTTYAHEELGKHKGYTYGRAHNLTRHALEENIAVLEIGKHALAFSSGVAAINSVLHLLKSGDHVIVSDNVYGGTYRLFEMVLKNFKLEFSWVNTSDFTNVEKALKPNSKMLYIETPTNPMLTLTDLELTSSFAKENNLISVCDNTFLSPYFQQPLTFGIDIVIHSSTKYLNGHSDVIGGIVVTNNSEHFEKLKFIQNSAGAIPSPFDCWLTLRSVKTLAVRMERHQKNAVQLSNYLSNHPRIKKVFYPGLKTHPQYQLVQKQMKGFGGMISIEIGDITLATKFVNSVKLFTLAESLGGIESLLCQPFSMTHKLVPKEEKQRLGITESLIRLSVGIEDIEDLVEDIEQALK